MDHEATKEAIEKIASQYAEDCFVESYKVPETLQDSKENGLGIALAKWSNFDGYVLLRVLAYALEDSNFHRESQEVLNLID